MYIYISFPLYNGQYSSHMISRNANELLAELYADDRGMPQGNSSAMKLLKEGMRVGSEKAATNLGTLYGQQR